MLSPYQIPQHANWNYVFMLLILSCRSSNSMKATRKAHGTNSIEMSYSAMNFIEFKGGIPLIKKKKTKIKLYKYKK